MKFLVLALFGTLLVAQTAAAGKRAGPPPDREIRDYFVRLLKDVGINNLDNNTAHILVVDIQKSIVDLAQSAGRYDQLSPLYNKFFAQLLVAARSKDGTGPELSKAVDYLEAIRYRLADKIEEPKLIIVDAFLDTAKVLRRDAQNALAIQKAKAISKANGTHISGKQVRYFIVNNVLEAYKQGVNISVNPVKAIANVAKAHMAIDVAHPLSSSLRRLINALEAERDLIYPKQNGVVFGHSIIHEQIRSLKQAKARQDDSLLNGLSGKALSLYESIVEDLKDLKPLLHQHKKIVTHSPKN